MKSLFKSKQFLLVMSTMLCLIIGLLATLAVMMRSESIERRSNIAMCRAEMEASAVSLLDDVAAGDRVRAYHNAACAADYALRSGEREGAILFNKIADEALRGELNEEITEVVNSYLARSDESTQRVRNTSKTPTQETKIHHPTFVSIEKYELAKDSANRTAGGNYVFTEGVRTDSGAYIFSCGNAYALIDEKTVLPIEGAVSLSEHSGNLNDAECETVAKEYLKLLFPSDEEAFESPIDKLIDEPARSVTYVYLSGEREIKATVNRTSGRVVSFSRR